MTSHAFGSSQKVFRIVSHTFPKLHPRWKRWIALPISKIDDYVMHIFRERSQKADHLADLGAQGQRQLLFDLGKTLKDGRR